MVYDFHTHTFLSDGSLSPVELVRRAVVNGYRAIAITDHAAMGTLERVLGELVEECALAQAHWDIIALPGVELTHVPPAAMNDCARRAKELGAKVVVVHGETIMEPVEPGTNLAALSSPHVDILAHPGLLTLEEAELAARNGKFLELSARHGHSFANGHVTAMARRVGARLLVDSDAHAPQDLLTPSWAQALARGAGLLEEEEEGVLLANPLRLLRRLGLVLPEGPP